MANAKATRLDMTLNDPADLANGFWWMVGYQYVIYEWIKLRLGPLVL